MVGEGGGGDNNYIGPSSACFLVFACLFPESLRTRGVRLPMLGLCVSFVGACSVRNTYMVLVARSDRPWAFIDLATAD